MNLKAEARLEVWVPLLNLYCRSCPSIEANRCLHSNISTHKQESNRGWVGGECVIPFLKAVISEGTKSTKRKRKLKTILQDIVLSDALYVSLSLVPLTLLLIQWMTLLLKKTQTFYLTENQQQYNQYMAGCHTSVPEVIWTVALWRFLCNFALTLCKNKSIYTV